MLCFEMTGTQHMQKMCRFSGTSPSNFYGIFVISSQTSAVTMVPEQQLR